jgi:hypothetical protein
MEQLTEEYLIIIDMPGQIELYTHIPILPSLVRHLTRMGSLHINLCAAYLLESTFIVDKAKFFSGTLSAMSAMIMLEIPHVNILSKMDLVKDSIGRRDLKRFLHPDMTLLDEDTNLSLQSSESVAWPTVPAVLEEETIDPSSTDSIMGGASFARLNRTVAQLIDDFSMVSFLRLESQNEESLTAVLSYIDDAIQFHEAQEPKEPKDEVEVDYET